jgi:hypothetical protein
MTQVKVDPAVYVALREGGMTNYQIAEKLRVDESSVRRGLRKAGYKAHLLPSYFQEQLDVILEAPIRFDIADKGPGAITSDWHWPLTDVNLVNTFIDHARDIGATNWLLINGDWFNSDALSSFDFKQETASLDRETQASTPAMRKLLETFGEVTLSWGNHDARMHKALGYKVAFTKAMRMLFEDLEPELMERITLSNLDHQIVDTPRGPYYICHPKAYTSVPLTGARRLASKELMNIVTGHSHHTAIGHDPSGKFVCAELGGFFDASKTAYLQRSTTFPKWQQGYGFIDAEGYLVIEGQGWSSRIGRRT